MKKATKKKVARTASKAKSVAIVAGKAGLKAGATAAAATAVREIRDNMATGRRKASAKKIGAAVGVAAAVVGAGLVIRNRMKAK
jgi:hypothetical protein